MDKATQEHLHSLEESLHRDIDEESVSLIPPGTLIQMLPLEEEDVQDSVKAICFAHLLRLRINGWDREQAHAHGLAYLRLPEHINDYLFGIMPLVTEALNSGLNDLSSLYPDESERDKRLHTRLMQHAQDAYKRQAISSWNCPSEDALNPSKTSMPDGDIINNSFSTNAPKIRASFLRILKYDRSLASAFKGACVIFLIASAAIGGCIWLYATGHWVWGTLLAIILFLFKQVIGMVFLGVCLAPRRIKQMYGNALLSPALIISEKPLRCLCTANLSNGMGEDYVGVKIIEPSQLPISTIKIGRAIPCVSTFEDGEHDDRWDDFSPSPIEWGTGDKNEVKRCMEKLDEDDRKTLAKVYTMWQNKAFTEKDVNLWVLNEAHEIIDRKQSEHEEQSG